MNHPTAPDDGRLMAWLSALLREADPPPPDAMELARQSFLLRTLDADLAALVEDSAAAGSEQRRLAVRDTAPATSLRQLTYHFPGGDTGGDSGDLVIAVEVEARDLRRRLTGHLDPLGAAEVELRQPSVRKPRRADADPRGRFVLDDVLPGPASLICRRAGQRAVATEWTIL